MMPPWELWCAVTIEVDKRRLVVVGAVSFKPPTEYDLWGGGRFTVLCVRPSVRSCVCSRMCCTIALWVLSAASERCV